MCGWHTHTPRVPETRTLEPSSHSFAQPHICNSARHDQPQPQPPAPPNKRGTRQASCNEAPVERRRNVRRRPEPQLIIIKRRFSTPFASRETTQVRTKLASSPKNSVCACVRGFWRYLEPGLLAHTHKHWPAAEVGVGVANA